MIKPDRQTCRAMIFLPMGETKLSKRQSNKSFVVIEIFNSLSAHIGNNRIHICNHRGPHLNFIISSQCLRNQSSEPAIEKKGVYAVGKKNKRISGSKINKSGLKIGKSGKFSGQRPICHKRTIRPVTKHPSPKNPLFFFSLKTPSLAKLFQDADWILG